jgi:UDP-3-O-acyl-N-acetylglucosamine deacetylase
MNNKKFWSFSLVLSFLALTGMKFINENNFRQPASAFSPVTLEIKNIQLPENKQLDSLKDVSLVATFNRNQKIDILNNRKLSLNAGQSLDLNIRLSIDPSWIQNEQLEFRIELVKRGFLDQVLVRCSQVSKKIRDYNRSYQCFLPDVDDKALLTYSLSTDSKSTIKSIAQK